MPYRTPDPRSDDRDRLLSDIIDRLKEREVRSAYVLMGTGRVAELALADARVASVVVDVRKTAIIPEARSVGVIIRRQRAAAGGRG
jgi:dihydroneopterin aldolase